MAVDNLEYVDEGGFPKSVRKLLNRCASRLNRIWEFRVATDGSKESKIEQSEEKVVVTLPLGVPLKDGVFIANGTPYLTDVLTTGRLDPIT